MGEFGVSFSEQSKDLGARVIDKAKELHLKEGVYRTTEDKLIQMIIEYRRLIEHDEAAAAKSQSKEESKDVSDV